MIMYPKFKAIGGFALLVVLATLACGLPGSQPAGPLPTPTPMGDVLVFNLPDYNYNLEPGAVVPGTRLEYVGREGDIYHVKIDNLAATKSASGSLIWNGVMAPGVYGNFNLRLNTPLLGGLQARGPVDITIYLPNPMPRPTPPLNEEIALSISNLQVAYLVPEGRQIPGTTLVFERIVSQGEGGQATQLAQLSGLSGYPYLATNDSISWLGNLRDNVVVRYSLVTTAIDENGLHLNGTAELWILN
jgi:hypothetical protein